MATFKKRGEKWTAEIRIKGKYSSKSFGTKNEAKDWARTEEHRLSRSGVTLAGKTLREAFRRYAEEESPKKKGCHWEQIRLKKFERDEIASIALSDLRCDDFEDWVKRQKKAGLKAGSVLRELRIISSVITKANKWEWLEGNPMRNMDRPKTPRARDKIITVEERENIILALQYQEKKPIRTAQHQIAVAFLFAIETAMRHGEIWKMHWEDIAFDKCSVHLSDTKNGEEREVALSKRAIELLRKMEPKDKGRVFTVPAQSADVIYRRAVELAGYKGIITFHDTRHTAITHLAGKLKNMLDLARMTGHKNPKNLLIYYNPTASSIAQQLD